MKRVLQWAIAPMMLLMLGVATPAFATSAFIQLSQLAQQADDIVVPQGTTATYDAAKGPLTIKGNLVNHGTIRITSSKKGASSITIEAASVVNDGSIVSDLPGTVLLKNHGTGDFKISADGGLVQTADTIEVLSDGNISLVGGTFKSKRMNFDTPKSLWVKADRIDGKVNVIANSAAVGVATGNLRLGEQLVKADPIFYNSGGSVTITPLAYNQDFVALASGDVNASGSGTVDTSSNSGSGFSITIAAGVTFTTSQINGAACPCTYTITGASAGGGNINFGAVNLLTNSNTISLTARKGTSGGGNVLADNVTTTGMNNGPGGNITVTADGAVTTGAINAQPNGVTSIGGNVTITAGAEAGIATGSILANPPSIQGGGFVLLNSAAGPGNTGGPVQVNGNLSAGSYIQISTPLTLMSGIQANTITISGAVSTNGATVLLRAGNNISSGAISTNGGVGGGPVDIYANLGADSSTATQPFVTGGVGTANGVNGSIVTDTVNAGNNNAIHLWNGGMGGITLTHSTDLSVAASAAKAGLIVLDAQSGPLTLPAGTLSADGASNGAFPAGRIVLMANTISATAGPTKVTASDNGSGLQHHVWLAAAQINYGADGVSHALVLNANGDGPAFPPTLVSGVQFGAQGSITVTDTLDPTNLVITVNNLGNNQPLTLSGSGTLDVNANGANEKIQFLAYPTTFASGSGAVNVNANGSNTKVIFNYPGPANVQVGLAFLGSQVTVNANGTGNAAGGTVSIFADNIATPSSAAVTINANGAGTGNGGKVNFSITNTTNVLLGTASGDFTISAKGGSAGSNAGDGGAVTLQGDASTTYTFDTQNSTASGIDVSALGTNGAGGTIMISAGGINANATAVALVANGQGSGKGGTISLEVTSSITSPVTLGNTLRGITLSAQGLGTGDGGTISVVTATALTVDSSQVLVTAGPMQAATELAATSRSEPTFLS